MMNGMRIGFGYDVHQFEKGRPLIIGGVQIDFKFGLAGHSDADVLLHAITDALLGALALGDIGTHFSDKDAQYQNIDSRILLEETMKMIGEKGYKVGNIDATVVAQKPKLSPYIQDMRKIIAKDLLVELEQVSVKATTSEKMGFVGREEGIAAQAVALIVKKS